MNTAYPAQLRLASTLSHPFLLPNHAPARARLSVGAADAPQQQAVLVQWCAHTRVRRVLESLQECRAVPRDSAPLPAPHTHTRYNTLSSCSKTAQQCRNAVRLLIDAGRWLCVRAARGRAWVRNRRFVLRAHARVASSTPLHRRESGGGTRWGVALFLRPAPVLALNFGGGGGDSNTTQRTVCLGRRCCCKQRVPRKRRAHARVCCRRQRPRGRHRRAGRLECCARRASNLAGLGEYVRPGRATCNLRGKTVPRAESRAGHHVRAGGARRQPRAIGGRRFGCQEPKERAGLHTRTRKPTALQPCTPRGACCRTGEAPLAGGVRVVVGVSSDPASPTPVAAHYQCRRFPCAPAVRTGGAVCVCVCVREIDRQTEREEVVEEEWLTWLGRAVFPLPVHCHWRSSKRSTSPVREAIIRWSTSS